MNTKTLSVTEMARHFSDYVNRVAYRQETFVLRKGRKPVAEVRPVPTGRRLGDLPEILRSLPHLSKGDVTAYADDVEHARNNLAAEEIKDPWAS
jgi:antitoxin (DNA-binding transcriptional repressor) of toxin-antitoxin stability system